MDDLAEGVNHDRERNILKSKKQRTLTITLFVVYTLLLVGIILFKLPFYSEKISDGIRVVNLIPFTGSFDQNGALFPREIFYNILLFIPLGIYISMLKSQWPFIKKSLTVIGISLSFEVLQLIFALGRTDITDLIDNTLGGIIGLGIYALLLRICKAKTVRVTNIIALVVTVCVVWRFSQLFYLSHFVMGRLP